jgi:hypothetical protein
MATWMCAELIGPLASKNQLRAGGLEGSSAKVIRTVS